jgi:hypothetical protein
MYICSLTLKMNVMKTKLLLSAIFLFTALFLNGQWIYNNLPASRDRMGVAVVGTKAYFAGGEDVNNNPVSTVYVYDAFLEDWDPAIQISLFLPRMHTAGVACGNWILFAGGSDMGTGQVFSDVDMWNTANLQHLAGELLVPRVFLSAVSNGQKALFAGGTNLTVSYDVVDIYDAATGDWSASNLSLPRSDMGATVIGDMAFFAGGYLPESTTVTDVVDIYHFSSGTWTTATLSQARGFLSAATVGSKVVFAGGTKADNQPSDRVDIYDTLTQTWDTASLSFPRSFFDPSGAYVCQNKVYFPSGGPMDLFNHQLYATTDVIDIYNASDNTWSVEHQTHSLVLYAAAGVEDHFILAGGWTSTGVFSSTVEIYHTNDPSCHVGINPGPVSDGSFRVYPNPTSGNLHLEVPGSLSPNTLPVCIYNMQGQLLVSQTLEGGVRDLKFTLSAGIYLLKIIAEDKIYSELITVQ